MSSPIAQGNTNAASDAQWFSEEIRPFEQQLRAYLHREFPTLRDTDDLLQESYVRMLGARRQGNIRCVRSYLFIVARNVAFSLFRKKRTSLEISVADFSHLNLADSANVIDEANARQHEALVVEAIDSLPARCREVMTLWLFEHLNNSEIANRLGIAEATVRIQLMKGAQRCAAYFEKRGLLNERR